VYPIERSYILYNARVTTACSVVNVSEEDD
jgi:hypothetical protein